MLDFIWDREVTINWARRRLLAAIASHRSNFLQILRDLDFKINGFLSPVWLAAMCNCKVRFFPFPLTDKFKGNFLASPGRVIVIFSAPF
jgi:hypothetical protein